MIRHKPIDGRRLRDIREFHIWRKMVRRCTVPKDTSYARYGARGITVDPSWVDSFEMFLRQMGPCPPGFQLDRTNNDLGYSATNCRWVSPKTNTRNRRCTIRVEWQGKTVALAELAEKFRRPFDVVKHRVGKLGWDLERALTTPVGPHGGDVKLPYEQRAHVRAAQRKAA